MVENFMRRDHQIHRASNSWNTASAVFLPQSIHPQATCALVHTECHGPPSVAKHASIQILKLPRLGGVQDHSGHPGTSFVDAAAALLEGNFTRPRRHRADITNIELVGLLTILQNHTIFEIFIPTTSIGNLDPVLRHPISTPRHDKLSISTPVRQLSREETIEVIETKGAMVSSETIWNEVQVARTGTLT